MSVKPAEVFENYCCTTSLAKTQMTPMKLFLLGILAGVYIGFGAIFATTAMTGVAVFGLQKALGGLVFSVGLILVVVAGAELFTGNVLLLIPLMEKKVKADGFFKNWTIVFIANFIGSLLLAGIFLGTELWRSGNTLSAVGEQALTIANAKAGLTWGQAFFRGMLCNILVDLAVIMTMAAKSTSGKIMAIIFPISAFVACGFEHSIANMYFIPTGLFIKGAVAADAVAKFSNLNWGNFFMNNLIPVTLGNIVGPFLFLCIPYFLVFRKKSV